MGKRLIQQARGKGGPAYRALGFRYLGAAKFLPINKGPMEGFVKDILHCSGHTAPLLKIKWQDGTEGFAIAPEGIKVGSLIKAGPGAPVEIGNILALQDIPEGQTIFNIEGVPGDGGKYCRTSGVAAKIVAKYDRKALVELPSKKQRLFDLACRAMIGIPAGGGRVEKPFLKAGNRHFAARRRNKRYPMISGAAQNAVDHPFGNKRTARKAKQRPAPRYAPPGRKVGKLHPRRTGRKK